MNLNLLTTLFNFSGKAVKCGGTGTSATQGSGNTTTRPRGYVGIDLGTTNTCVFITYESTGLTENFMFNEQPTLPSLIYCCKNGSIYSGYEALAYDQNPDKISPGQLFYGFKRVNGKVYTTADPDLMKFIKNVTYKVEGHTEKGSEFPKVTFPWETEVDGKKKTFYHTPTTFNVKLLSYIRACIEQDVDPVATIITTPAYFSENQNKETLLAARLAGFKNVTTEKEPTAAVACYAQDYAGMGTERVLCFDLGGGTFDISVVEIDNSKNEDTQSKNSTFSFIDVIKVRGDNYLGGDDTTGTLSVVMGGEGLGVKNLATEVEREGRTLLWFMAEEYKKAACTSWAKGNTGEYSEKFFIPAKALGKNFVTPGKEDEQLEINFSMGQDRYKQLNESFYHRILGNFNDPQSGLFTSRNENDPKIDIKSINKVVLVGGSTRDPHVKILIRQVFGPDVIISDEVDPDLVVAKGASIMCAAQNSTGKFDSLSVQKVTSLPVGIEVQDGSFVPIVDKDKPLPTSASKTFSNTVDMQEQILVKFASGVRPRFSDNELIGDFKVKIHKPGPRGSLQFDINVTVSEDNSMNIKVTEQGAVGSSGYSPFSYKFTECYKTQDPEEIKRIMEEAEKHAEADKEFMERTKAVNEFSSGLDLYEKYVKQINKDKAMHEAQLSGYKEFFDSVKKDDSMTSDHVKTQLEELNKDVNGAKEIFEAESQAGAAPGGGATAEKTPEEQEAERRREAL